MTNELLLLRSLALCLLAPVLLPASSCALPWLFRIAAPLAGCRIRSRSEPLSHPTHHCLLHWAFAGGRFSEARVPLGLHVHCALRGPHVLQRRRQVGRAHRRPHLYVPCTRWPSCLCVRLCGLRSEPHLRLCPLSAAVAVRFLIGCCCFGPVPHFAIAVCADLERFLEKNVCLLTPLNVRPFLICAFLTASKVWDDKGCVPSWSEALLRPGSDALVRRAPLSCPRPDDPLRPGSDALV